MDGLSCLGAEANDFDYVSFLQKAGPSVVTEATQAIKPATPKTDPITGKPIDPATGKPVDGKGAGGKGGGGSFLTDPLIGPIPGYGVIGALLAAVGGIWYFKRK